jgi:hypothetical protein
LTSFANFWGKICQIFLIKKLTKKKNLGSKWFFQKIPEEAPMARFPSIN